MGLFRLRVGPVWSELLEGDRATVDKLTSIEDPQAANSASAAVRLTDGLHHFFSQERDGCLPSGLVPRLAGRLAKRGHALEVEYDPDGPAIEAPPADCLVGVTLREHQVAGLGAALRDRCGLLYMATNAGKSEIIAALCLAFRGAGMRGVVIVPNTNILHGLTKRLRLRVPGLRVGVLGDGHRDLQGDVVVTNYQTAQQALPRRGARPDAAVAAVFEMASYVLVDEAHHSAGRVYQQLLKMCFNATYRLGFTGSVDKKTKRTDAEALARSAPGARLHRWEVESFLGPVLHRTENAEMIEAGFSARPRVFVVDDRAAYGPLVPTPKQRPGKKPINVYNEVFQRAAVQDRRWLVTIARVVRKLILAGKPPFVFSHSVDHLRAISAVLTERAVPHKLLHGVDGTQRRDAVVAAFAARQDFALLCSSIFDEGADVPEIRAVVFAGARRAVVELLQRLGRGLRAKGEDNCLTVVDFRPHHSEMLKDQFEDRRALYQAEGFTVRRIVDISALSEVDL